MGRATESSKYWLSVLNGLKNRGVQDILIVSVDGLNGFSEAIAVVYPKTDIQRCIIHQIRSSIRYVSYKDVKAFTAALKPIYKAPTEDGGRLWMNWSAFGAPNTLLQSVHGGSIGANWPPCLITQVISSGSSIPRTPLRTLTGNSERSQKPRVPLSAMMPF